MLKPWHFLLGALLIGAWIGGPIVWIGSQFHPPAIATHDEGGGQHPKSGATYVVKEHESYLDKVVDPIAISTYVLCVVTGWLAWFTRGLFQATARLASDADKASAKALEASTEATKLAAATAKQLRAYLGIDAGAATVRGSRVEFWVNVKNQGRTPAYDVSRVMRADILDPEATGTPDFSLPPRGEGRWMIVPGAFWTPRRFLNLIDVEAGQRDESLGAFFWGRIEYTDTFGDAHWMTFRYRLGIRMGNALGQHVGWELDVTEDGNDADRNH